MASEAERWAIPPQFELIRLYRSGISAEVLEPIRVALVNLIHYTYGAKTQ